MSRLDALEESMAPREKLLLAVARRMYDDALMFFWETVDRDRDVAGDVHTPEPWEADYLAAFSEARDVLDEYVGIRVPRLDPILPSDVISLPPDTGKAA